MTNNTLAFIALCTEYCQDCETAQSTELTDFVNKMLRILPRIYISATDLSAEGALDEGYLDASLDEDSYDAIQNSLASLFGEFDSYLEVFVEDMKYSDTPINANISENLADLYQVFYNFVQVVKEAPDDLLESAIAAIKDDFKLYWSQILCNALRALNSLYETL